MLFFRLKSDVYFGCFGYSAGNHSYCSIGFVHVGHDSKHRKLGRDMARQLHVWSVVVTRNHACGIIYRESRVTSWYPSGVNSCEGQPVAG